MEFNEALAVRPSGEMLVVANFYSIDKDKIHFKLNFIIQKKFKFTFAIIIALFTPGKQNTRANTHKVYHDKVFNATVLTDIGPVGVLR